MIVGWLAGLAGRLVAGLGEAMLMRPVGASLVVAVLLVGSGEARAQTPQSATALALPANGILVAGSQPASTLRHLAVSDAGPVAAFGTLAGATVVFRWDAAGTVTTQRGFGDVILRLKVNLWGNDGGTTAAAVMPYLKLPTNQDQLGNNSVEGGLILPLAVKLPAGWDMGIMTQFDFNRDLVGRGRHVEFINSITFAHDLVGKLGGYVEFFSSATAEAGVPWVGTLDVGFTFGLTDNLQLDAGVNLGITRAADDINPFLGLSWRF